MLDILDTRRLIINILNNKSSLDPKQKELLKNWFDSFYNDKYGTDDDRDFTRNYNLLDIIDSYGFFMPSFIEWAELIYYLHNKGIKKILAVASGTGGKESILYHLSRLLLDEPFEIILTDGHLGKTKPKETYNLIKDGINLLPVEHISASEAIAKYPDVDAFIALMLPMDSHFDKPDDECPGLCMAENTYKTDKPMIVFGEYRHQCCGSEKYWDFVENNLTCSKTIEIKYKFWGTYFHIDIYNSISNHNDSSPNT